MTWLTWLCIGSALAAWCLAAWTWLRVRKDKRRFEEALREMKRRER